MTKDNISKAISSMSASFDGLIEQDVVDHIYSSHSYTNPSTGNVISTSRRKLFAILIMLGIPDRIGLFIKENIWDIHLPFQKNSVTREWESHGPGGTMEPLVVPCFNDDAWQTPLADLFDTYQWYMLAPVFDMRHETMMHYLLHENTPLPFIKHSLNEAVVINGGFGEVRKVMIHPAHHNLQSKNSYFAVKRLRIGTELEVDREVETLRLFRNLDDPYLIKLLTTYHDGEHLNLVFPWADSNLREYWQHKPRIRQDYTRTLWIAEQCLGIAEAVRKIHYNEFMATSSRRTGASILKGRHGDIKPDNILWFSPREKRSSPGHGLLVLSDFGLAKFHHAHSAQRKYNRDLAHTTTYRAPEFGLNGHVSPSWDTWTLGCVYLEFIIWYLQGWNAVDLFAVQRQKYDLSFYAQEDTYFTLEKRSKFGAYRKIPVIKKVKELHGHPSCTEFIHDFLDLISMGMLRIRPDMRFDCAVVVQRMQQMLERCRKNQAYCTEATPKTFVTRVTNESDKRPRLSRISEVIEAYREDKSRAHIQDNMSAAISAAAAANSEDVYKQSSQKISTSVSSDTTPSTATAKVDTVPSRNTETRLPEKEKDKNKSVGGKWYQAIFACCF
ncbi:putative Protein kinase domain-containing protein [Seiridium cardinale]|uniref:Protein kinase domain-containing protein n=1 Tax=Seiridium cardinale TaxID=138064 RepID=A0ABR2XSQ9_9PEZI